MPTENERDAKYNVAKPVGREMAPGRRSRRQRVRDREIAWMAAAIINVRYSVERFAPLLSLVRNWPDAKLCALADRLAPLPGILKGSQASLKAIEQSYRGPPAPEARILQIGMEVVAIFGDEK